MPPLRGQTFEAPQKGLLFLLTEECLVPKGSDEAFCEKVRAGYPKSNIATRVKGRLSRNHALL